MSNQILARQWRDLVLRPVLAQLGRRYDSPSSIALMSMIAAHESGSFNYIRQVAGWNRGPVYGPARGFLQMEPATEDDTWRYLWDRQPDLARSVRRFRSPAGTGDNSDLIWNLAYQVAIGRAKLWMVPAKLPDPRDLEGLGRYAKDHWNTSAGSATAAKYIHDYRNSFPPSQWDFIPVEAT